MNRQQVRAEAPAVTFPPRGRIVGRLGVLAAVLALALIGAAAGRHATPAAAASDALLCDGAQINTGACLYLTQDTPDLRTKSFNDRASSVYASFTAIALYAEINYQGKCQTISPQVAVALAGSWVGDNAVSSVRMGPCLDTDVTAPKIWTGNPAATGSGPWIGDVMVISGSTNAQFCPSGWEVATHTDGVSRQDLNEYAGGDFVYLCLRRTDTPTFYMIYAVAGNSSNVACDPGDYKVPGDLNKGAGGKFIYFCVNPELRPFPTALTKVTIAAIKTNRVSGFSTGEARAIATQGCNRVDSSGQQVLDPQDLNAGTGSKTSSAYTAFIFACVRYDKVPGA